MSVASEQPIWTPTAEQSSSARLRTFLHKLGVADLAACNELARTDPERFWETAVDDVGIEWTKRPHRMQDTSKGLPWTKWWIDGDLNLATNACDRWAARKPDAKALAAESEEGTVRTLTYAELSAEVARVCG